MSKFCNGACIFILGAFILASFVAMIFLPIEYTAGYISAQYHLYLLMLLIICSSPI